MQLFAHRVISPAQVIENKSQNFGTQLAPKGVQTLGEDVWTSLNIR